MIIIEGPDHMGKTTLIGQLKESFPILEVSRSIGNSPGLARWLMKEILINKKNKIKIYDRFFFSELVYGPLLRGRACFTSTEDELILGMLTKIKPLVIICDRPIEDVVVTIDDSEQMVGVDSGSIAAIQREYHKVVIPLLRENEIPLSIYNFNLENAYEGIKSRVASKLWRVIK